MVTIGRAAFFMAMLLTLAGCAGEKGKEVFETAQFEEKQHNVEHAKKL